MHDEAFAQAWALLELHGSEGAGLALLKGMRAVPPGDQEKFRQWEAIADQMEVIVTATRH